MKKAIKIIAWIAIPIILIIVCLYIFKVDYILKAVRVTYLTGHKTAFLEDYTYFENRTISHGVGQPWKTTKDYNTIAATPELEKTHQELKTVAYLIIKNDSIFHEAYFDGYDQNSHSNSFSMAKSIVTSALGKAIMQGYIKNLDQKVTDFLPELKGAYASELTVGDLASMSSGLSWDENYYGAFSITTQAYFDTDLRNVMYGLEINDKPSQKFIYQSGDTQLLAMVLEKATHTSLSEYVSEVFWKPMGAENDALWQIDHKGDGIEKAYCCIASNARDFARFGKLYLQGGLWNGTEILPKEFIEKSIHPRFNESPQYGYGWWLNTYMDKQMYYMRGHLGQFVIVVPEDNLIIVRLGHIKGEQTKTDPHSNDFYVYVAEAYKMLEQRKK